MNSDTPDYPEYEFVPSTIVANGETLASQYKNKDGTIVTDVSLSQASVDRKNKLQNLINDYENSINVFSPEQNAEFQAIADAQKNSAINVFNSIYEPTVRKSREDYFSRMGTLDSTAYLDRYNDLEATKQKAYADIANDYVANLNELKDAELARRYSYLDYLQSGVNNLNSASSAYLNMINSSGADYSNSYNSYLNNAYKSSKEDDMGVDDWASILNIFSNIWSA